MVEGKIVNMLTGKNSLEEVSVDELKTIAQQQPYFSVAQLLLTKKMKQTNHPEFQEQLHRTSLYFPDTHWLHFQLDQADTTFHNPETISDNIVTETEVASTIDADSNDVHDNNVLVQTSASENESADVIAEENITNTEDDENLITEDESPKPSEQATYEEEDAALSSVEIEEQNSNLAKILSEQAKAFQQPVTASTPLPIETEPYHTIDYFASQGIKLDRSLPAQDQLERKVRKFTDWLKQMKKTGPQPVDLGTTVESENIVKDIAENSNEQKEVLTEAMADVLIKQGKTEKAIQLYIKLSFLNPDKSAYFAAKIQALKGI